MKSKKDIYEKAIKKYIGKYSPPEVSFEEAEEGGIKVYIDTERLSIESASSKDGNDYYNYLFSQSNVMKLYGDGTTKTKEYTEERLKIWEQRWGQKNPFSALKISNKEEEREKDFVGHIVPGGGDLENSSEIAYLLREDKWNQGYGYEAAGAIILEYCPLLKHKGYNPPGYNGFEKIIATARVDNIASNEILKNLSFKIYKEEQKFGALRNHYTIDVIDASEIINVWSASSDIVDAVTTHVKPDLIGDII